MNSQPTTTEVDVVVIGAGHNGLICASYLARAGLSVTLFERRLEAGGGLCTEEVTRPGFLHNLASVFHDTAQAMPAMTDLDLASFGATYTCPEVQLGILQPHKPPLMLYDDVEQTIASITEHSPKDGRAWAKMVEDYAEYMDMVVLPALYAPPAHPKEQELALGGSAQGRAFLEMSKSTPLDVLQKHFSSEAVAAAVLFQLAIPRGVLPDYKGLGMMVPLIVSGVERSQLAIGGSHNLAHALWRALIKAGGKLRGTLAVEQIWIEQDKAVGVVLETGERIRARRGVVSAVDFKQTVLSLLSPDGIPADIKEDAKHHKLDEFSIFGVHLALKEAPRYRAASAAPDLDRAYKVAINGGDIQSLEQMWKQIRNGELPDPPVLYAVCPTLFDPSQAPPQHHTAFCWAPAPFYLRDGGAQAWDTVKEAFADQCIQTWSHQTHNLTQDNILARRVFSPLDIPRKFSNMREGGVFMGRMSHDQLEWSRPTKQAADYRLPIKGLYLAGAGQHPGGGIVGAAGQIAAETLLDDLGIEPWWL